MEHEYEKEVVEIFLYKRLGENEKINSEGMRLDIFPLTNEKEFKKTKVSEFLIRNSFQLVVKEVLITGVVSKKIKLFDRLVQNDGDITRQELRKLSEPLLSIIQRLVYDTTEIALDLPGVKVDFKEVSAL